MQHTPPNANFKGFKPGGGFVRKPPECGPPRTGQRTGWANVDKREAHCCPSCYRAATRPGRALCNACRQRDQRNGDPSARGPFPVRKMLGKVIAEAWRMIRYLDTIDPHHPARRLLDHSRLWLNNQLHLARPYIYTSYRHGQGYGLVASRRLAQLERHGVTVDQLLATVTGFLWAREHLPAMLVSEQHFKRKRCSSGTCPRAA